MLWDIDDDTANAMNGMVFLFPAVYNPKLFRDNSCGSNLTLYWTISFGKLYSLIFSEMAGEVV